VLSAFHLYTHFVRGTAISTNLVIGDTMIKHSHIRGTKRLLRFQTWSHNADGTRTGVWV
jgi:hypothetical protein